MGSIADRVREEATSEVKRWGGDRIGLHHLAALVDRQRPDLLAERLGPSAHERLVALLRARDFGTTEPEVVDAVIAAATDARSLPEGIAAIAAELGNRLGELPTLDPTTSDGAGDAAPTAPSPTGPTGPSGAADATDAGPAQGGAAPGATTAAPAPATSGPSLGAELVGDPGVIARDELVDELLVMLGRHRPFTPLLVGRPGTGRSAVLAGLAARLHGDGVRGLLHGTRVRSLDLGRSPFDLQRLIDDPDAGTAVWAIEDIEVMLGLGPNMANGKAIELLRAAVGVGRLRLVLTIDEAFVGVLSTLAPELFGELTPVRVPELDADALTTVVALAARELGEAHQVSIEDEVTHLAATAKGPSVGTGQPGLGISLLDSACARAVLRGADAVEPGDLRREEGRISAAIDYEGLCHRLGQAVVGQDSVIRTIAERLCLTRAELDLRPDRPDAVFLLVGPTGVGKTELSLAVCEEVFGSRSRLIRLDMSEYVQEWAVSRLTGPQPGYVGSTEPSNWLTTRVANQPESVILLDEIEKAHPVVWNTFLQVFDAGRLTDSRGVTADFSRTIVLMTSNLGAEAYTRRQVGFGGGNDAGDHGRARAEVDEAIRRSIAPELVNRLDGVLHFSPLSVDTIATIARQMVDRQVERMAARGYELRVTDEALAFLVRNGYDEAFGARHLQRNLDRHLLVPLAHAGSARRLVTEVDGTTLAWRPVD